MENRGSGFLVTRSGGGSSFKWLQVVGSSFILWPVLIWAELALAVLHYCRCKQPLLGHSCELSDVHSGPWALSNHCFGTGQLGIHPGQPLFWMVQELSAPLFSHQRPYSQPCYWPLCVPPHLCPTVPHVLGDQNHTVNTTSASLIGYSAITVTQSGHQQIPPNQPGGRQPLLHSSAKPRKGPAK